MEQKSELECLHFRQILLLYFDTSFVDGCELVIQPLLVGFVFTPVFTQNYSVTVTSVTAALANVLAHIKISSTRLGFCYSLSAECVATPT